MRHLRPIFTLVAMAALVAACSAAPGSSSQPSSGGVEPSSGGGEPSAEASAAGGSGGGPNGSITYAITGSYQASGELPFIAAGMSLWDPSAGGWVANFTSATGDSAYILLNTATLGSGQIFTFGDGVALVAATSDPSTESGCTFNLTKNDESGLKGSVDCTTAQWSNLTTGAIGQVQLHAEWDAHP